MKTRRLALSLFALSLLTAACGRLTGAGSGAGADAIEHPTGPNDLVLRWEYVGGFVNPEALLGRIPAFSLYGDGSLVTEGPQIEIYPGPALPNLLVQTLSEEGIQEILSAARDAGLTNGDATYPYPCVADAADTRFTVVADGQTSVVTATAIGPNEAACPGADLDAREKLSAFWSKLGSLSKWLPAGSVGQERPYRAEALRIYAQPYVSTDPELEQSSIRWPGPALASLGDPLETMQDLRCAVLDGTDASKVTDAAASANQLTPWTSGGEDFAVTFRPLLPDESGC
jgi:hypothetical protein